MENAYANLMRISIDFEQAIREVANRDRSRSRCKKKRLRNYCTYSSTENQLVGMVHSSTALNITAIRTTIKHESGLRSVQTASSYEINEKFQFSARVNTMLGYENSV